MPLFVAFSFLFAIFSLLLRYFSLLFRHFSQPFVTRFRLDADVDLEQFSESLPFTYTGADFYALCSDAMLNALKRRVAAMDAAHTEAALERPGLTMERFLASRSKEELAVTINMADLHAARDALRPSVTEAEMERYRALQSEFAQQGDRVKQAGKAAARHGE